MDDPKSEKVALFRYGLIATLVLEQLSRGELMRRARELAALHYDIPFSERTTISVGTLLKFAPPSHDPARANNKPCSMRFWPTHPASLLTRSSTPMKVWNPCWTVRAKASRRAAFLSVSMLITARCIVRPNWPASLPR